MTSFVCAVALAVAAPVPDDKKVDEKKADEELQKKVDTARSRAVKYLKEKQGKEGDWEEHALPVLGGMKGGVTALVALALLEAGVPANEPAITKAVEYLVTLKSERTYVVSLQTQVLARVDAKKYAKQIQANADWLLEKAIFKFGKLDGWSYPTNQIADNSNTHFALMGLHAAAQAGAKVDAEIWKKIRDCYAGGQRGDGSWAYVNNSSIGMAPGNHSMTVGALAGLAVATKYDKNAKGPDPAFEKGMKALLDGKLGAFGGSKSGFVEWMTAAELGRALGTNEFKSGKLTKAWYREGAEKMVKSQQEDGSMKYTGERPMIDTKWPIVTTACGLYVLGPSKKK
jgi:hypothetical protein